MRKISFYTAFILLLVSSAFQSFAQDSAIVSWSTSFKKISDQQIELQIKGVIKSGWHLYSADAVEGLSGLEIKSNDSTVMLGLLSYLHPSKKITDPVFENKNKSVYEDSIEIHQIVSFKSSLPDVFLLQLSYELAQADNFITEEKKLRIALTDSIVVASNYRILIPSIDINHPLNDCGVKTSTDNKDSSSSGLLNLFFIGFLGGLIALLTPCVFPMIPLTVSFFTKKASTKKPKAIAA